MDPPDAEEAVDAAGDAAGWMWKNWDLVVERAGRVRAWLRGEAADPADASPHDVEGKSPPRPVLLLGPGGVGKSTFGRFASTGVASPFVPPEPYRESLTTETYRFAGDAEADLIVPPGQTHRRAASWADLLDQLGNGAFRGVMLFASYGYHSPGQFGGYQAHPLYDGRKAQFLNDYLTAKRAEEVVVAATVARKVRQSPNPVWLLTCVTKQDLWWPERPAVEAFFETGPYAAALNDALDGSDPALIRRELWFGCLAILNFRDQQREALAPNAAGYDDRAKAESLTRLVERLDDLRVWEQQR